MKLWSCKKHVWDINIQREVRLLIMLMCCSFFGGKYCCIFAVCVNNCSSLLRKVERHFLETCSVCQQALEQSLLASKQLSTWLTVASCMKDSKIGPVIENASSRVCTWHLHHRQETLSSHRGGMLFGALHPIKANQLWSSRPESNVDNLPTIGKLCAAINTLHLVDHIGQVVAWWRGSTCHILKCSFYSICAEKWRQAWLRSCSNLVWNLLCSFSPCTPWEWHR